MTDEKKARILTSVQLINLCAEIIAIEYQNDLVDSRFKQPAINNHSRRIKEGAQAIKTHLTSLATNKDKDFFNYDYSVEMHRLITQVLQMPAEQLRGINDQLESNAAPEEPADFHYHEDEY